MVQIVKQKKTQKYLSTVQTVKKKKSLNILLRTVLRRLARSNDTMKQPPPQKKPVYNNGHIEVRRWQHILWLLLSDDKQDSTHPHAHAHTFTDKLALPCRGSSQLFCFSRSLRAWIAPRWWQPPPVGVSVQQTFPWNHTVGVLRPEGVRDPGGSGEPLAPEITTQFVLCKATHTHNLFSFFF